MKFDKKTLTKHMHETFFTNNFQNKENLETQSKKSSMFHEKLEIELKIFNFS